MVNEVFTTLIESFNSASHVSLNVTGGFRTMNLNRRQLLGAAVVASAGLAAQPALAGMRIGSQPSLLPRAMAALQTHGRSIRHRDVIGIVDFAYPSSEPRFHLVDLLNG